MTARTTPRKRCPSGVCHGLLFWQKFTISGVFFYWLVWYTWLSSTHRKLARGSRNEFGTLYTRQGRGKYAMNLKKVHHIAIIGSNYEKSRRFYVDLLGFSVIRENYRPEREDYKIDLQLDGMELELFIIKNCPKRPSYPEAYGLRHLAFAVDSVDDTVRELNKRGIPTEPIRVDAYTGKKMTFLSDPDNLPLEIHE